MKRIRIFNEIKILIFILSFYYGNLNGITVDNQLVSLQNDCFERIALGAMLPFEKTFRVEDTNSLKICKEMCSRAGEKCQTIAFGVHIRGNGTCQLSSDKIDTAMSRPIGTIFDPDFDLYSRKVNCFDVPPNNDLPSSPGGSFGTTPLDTGRPSSNRPPPPPFGTVSTSLGTTPESEGTTNRFPPRPPYSSQKPTTSGSYPSTSGTNYPSTGASSYPASGSKYPSTSSNYPASSSSYPPSNTGYTQVSSNYPSTSSTAEGGYNVYEKLPSRPSNYPNTYYTYYTKDSERDKMYFSNDYPLYKYPSLYEETNPIGSYPGVYAPNVIPVDNRYKPPSESYGHTMKTTPRPVHGSGYGTGYSYGTPTYNRGEASPTSSYGGSSGSNHPTYYDRPDYNQINSNGDRYRPSNRPNDVYPDPNYGDYRPNTYDNRPGYNRPNYDNRPDYQTTRPSNNNRFDPRPNGNPYGTRPSEPVRPDYSVRPLPDGGNNGPPIETPLNTNKTPPQSSNGYGGTAVQPINQSTDRPPKPLEQPGPYGPRPEGKYNNSDADHHIETYFNPDEYIQLKWTTKPVMYPTRVDYGIREGSIGYDGYKDHYPDDTYRTCFRRVLAGKRIAPHWVRRTLACERVEDCMQECGHEKRFQCEGFNYRIDPSGHGQGDCELIEIPLAEMDLYSSPHQRDTNLLRHPDYDYYERDRNAPTSCRQGCKNCGIVDPKPISTPPLYIRPDFSSSGHSGPERYRPPSTTAVDKYRPPYEHRPDDYYEFSSHGNSYQKPFDRVDHYDNLHRPDRWESIPSGGSSYGEDLFSRPDPDRGERFRPAYRPGPDFSPYRPHNQDSLSPESQCGPPPCRKAPPPEAHHCGLPPCGPPISRGFDRGEFKKPPSKFIPYLIGIESEFSSSGTDGYRNSGNSFSSGGNRYGGSYSDYWGIKNDQRRKDDTDFNYFDLGPTNRPTGPHPTDNAILTYPGSRYKNDDKHYPAHPPPRDHYNFRTQWTRRPGPDDCSVKTSEGFRLHKSAIRLASTAPTLTECEQLCSTQDDFICHTYSYRYSTVGRENCLLCDRPLNSLDYYIDIEPDRDYDIYSMSDDSKPCREFPPIAIDSPVGGGHSTALSDPRNNDQCFFRAIDATRFYKSIVRDSLTVRSIGQCELECIKSTKFTCRAFAFRYGQRSSGGIIDNCQLSDWPVRDMDKERHLILDPSFDIFERASYGHGCEIQPIVDDKHKKLCYLGYGSPAKLLPPAIKKIISTTSESECKRECIQFRENSSFKCYSFSYGSQITTFNCELSDLDQSELKLNIHYTHTHEKDYWLFAWNPFDWTCRDKVTTIGGSRVNNNRRMDIFREPGDVTWRHFTVSGKACRIGSGCDKNLVTGFYSCEIDGGEIGSWDYCCKSAYPCGYSKGFDYPWCFVGDEPDQWRKCSDRYYPANQTHAGITLPPKGNKDKKKNEQYQRPPRPGGLQSLTDFTAARLWPVTYLYSEGPPNSTELSNFVDCNKESC